MGFILSKFRKKKSTYEVLEQLELEITNISQFKASTVVWQKKVVGYLVTYSIVIYLLLAVLVYFQLFPAAVSKQEQFLLLLPFLVFPFLIWGLRRFLTWWYHRKVKRDDKKLEMLKAKKTKILDEVMEKETYKVAKQILDKFGQSTPVEIPPVPTAVPRNQAIKSQGESAQLRRRPVAPSSVAAGGGIVPSSSTSKSNTSLVNSPRNSPAGPSLTTATRSLQGPQGPVIGEAALNQLLARPQPPAGGAIPRSAPGPPLPRPVLPRERGYFDKFVEYLVGDGPTNRYALICRQCQSHNGMALREEFEYVAYRCCYCHYWNPARKQRPVAPKLPDQSQLTSATDSSGSDVSPASSAPQSRRASVCLEGKVEPVGLMGDMISDSSNEKMAEENDKPVEEEEQQVNDESAVPMSDATDDNYNVNVELAEDNSKVKRDEEKDEIEEIVADETVNSSNLDIMESDCINQKENQGDESDDLMDISDVELIQKDDCSEIVGTNTIVDTVCYKE